MSWSLQEVHSDDQSPLGGNITALRPFHLNNTFAVGAGAMLDAQFTVLTGTITAVSDNVNGAWTRIAAVAIPGGGELSYWYYPFSAAVAINGLTVTGTMSATTHGWARAHQWTTGFGGLTDYGVASGTSTAPSASCRNNTSGDFFIVTVGNVHADDGAGSVTGDGVTPVGTINSVDCSITGSYNLNDTNTGTRSGGCTLASSIGWAAIAASFSLALPAVNLRRAGAWTRSTGIVKRSGLNQAAPGFMRRAGLWVPQD